MKKEQKKSWSSLLIYTMLGMIGVGLFYNWRAKTKHKEKVEGEYEQKIEELSAEVALEKRRNKMIESELKRRVKEEVPSLSSTLHVQPALLEKKLMELVDAQFSQNNTIVITDENVKQI